MDLREFVAVVGDFDSLGGPQKIKLIAWHLHIHQGRARFDKSDIRKCFAELHFTPPDMSMYFPRLIKAGDFLTDREGVRLSGKIRAAFDKKYGSSPTIIAVSSALAELPNKIPSLAEQSFLREAFLCYRAQAFRSAIVMAWNLTFHHLETWVVADVTRLASFNTALTSKYPKKGLAITKIEDFDTKDMKEFEVIETLDKAGLITSSLKRILNQKLELRNIAAHPSSIVLKEPAASDFILTLIDNVVLKFV